MMDGARNRALLRVQTQVAKVLCMPFTLTHIAAIIPFAAIAPRVLPFSALVIGSMIPDLPLFVPLPPTYATTHSLIGVFTACLPLGMACFLTFQYLMKRPLLALLPDIIRSRCASLSTSCIELTIGFFALTSLAIVIGAMTHVFWDSFTHQGRWGSSVFPRLNDRVLTIQGHKLLGYKALQYGSTFVLLPCLVILLFIWFSRQKSGQLDAAQALPKFWRMTLYAIAFLIPISVTLLTWTGDRRTPYTKLGQSITVSGLGLGIFFIAYSICYNVAFRRTYRPG